jgi:hypothetical protein
MVKQSLSASWIKSGKRLAGTCARFAGDCAAVQRFTNRESSDYSSFSLRECVLPPYPRELSRPPGTGS